MVGRSVTRGRHASVACGHGLATQAAFDAFAQGGNAVDAAVTSAYALMVLMPDACGIGGDAVFLISHKGRTEAHHGAGMSPKRLQDAIPEEGGGATAVPGAVAALEEVARRYGRLSREQHLAPAVELAEAGFPASEYLVRIIARQRARLTRLGTPTNLLDTRLRPGTIVRQPELASALRILQREGPEGFYEGPIAAAIARQVQADGGRLTADDLRGHQHLELPVFEMRARAATVISSPPPSQAVIGLRALKAMAKEPATGEADRVHVAIETIEAAFARRSSLVDPSAARDLIDAPTEIDRERAQHRGGPNLLGHTTAVATADEDGLVVSMLISVYSEFGCGAIVPEYGFFLNDRMRGFDDKPGGPNGARPNARPLHTLSPFLVETDDLRFAATTPGGHGQVQTMSQVLSGILLEELPIGMAIDRPRWQVAESAVLVEEDFDKRLAAALTSRGHQLRSLPRQDDLFGAVVVAGIDKAGGSVFSLADNRRDACAASR